MSTLPKILCIVGPTSSGKTALSLELAKSFNGEIVNADARQVYRGFDIGTGKPEGTIEERADRRVRIVEGITHHLMEEFEPTEEVTGITWREKADAVIQEILERGKLPIIVGGTGFYIRLLVDRLEPPAPPTEEIRERVRAMSLEEARTLLAQTDPDSYAQIDVQNPRRVTRALEVALSSGASFVAQQTKAEPKYQALMLMLDCSGEVLRERIAISIKQRFAEGWIEEVKTLLKRGVSKEAPAMTSIGYELIANYIEYGGDSMELEKQIELDTWHYAKRQQTWFRKEKGIVAIKDIVESKIIVERFFLP